eukprot:CAMPEP_0174353136 /NCGR_PEP_ID=MMETSP0811_2-20130205/13986_1 /TAXON_ID=73025 ORGANISM="Eutreptiella gymnastica-like, Strain CCMP1594" /NCGR_SAMPLE_ID=MMETSP0811_2 /ASSEMBLY_ACC=CAM_ASM_000667 /LENGTH=77 /DNA_ID=CAMNT_0015483535 /DNA_START=64 /DNA_END=297 /DNA_ORIENTATION=+
MTQTATEGGLYTRALAERKRQMQQALLSPRALEHPEASGAAPWHRPRRAREERMLTHVTHPQPRMRPHCVRAGIPSA